MRPPRCDVCDADAGAPGGALIRCVSSPADLEWRQRVEREGMVGHPPDTGWFCPDHAARARELAGGYRLGDVIAALREPSPAPTPAPVVAPDPDLDPAPRPVTPRRAGIGDFFADLRGALPALAELAGVDPAALSTQTRREWTPMDGTVAPNCPFTEYTFHRASAGGVTLDLHLEIAYWNEDDAARSYLTLDLSGAGERDFRVAAWSPASGDPYGVEAGQVRGNVPDFIDELIAARG